jgi:hypothetical protein
VYRGCAAEHSPSQRRGKRWLEQESIAKVVVAGGWKGNMCGGEVEKCGARRAARGFRVGKSGFMPQRLTVVENGVGSRQQ